MGEVKTAQELNPQNGEYKFLRGCMILSEPINWYIVYGVPDIYDSALDVYRDIRIIKCLEQWLSKMKGYIGAGVCFGAVILKYCSPADHDNNCSLCDDIIFGCVLC